MKEKTRTARLDVLFAKRSRAATRGSCLPTTQELLYGMPFRNEDLTSDSRTFINLLYRKWSGLTNDEPKLHDSLQAVLKTPDVEAFRRAAQSFRGITTERRMLYRGYEALRFDFYAAHLGCLESTRRVAANISYLAVMDRRLSYRMTLLLSQALGWSSLGTELEEADFFNIGRKMDPDEIRERVYRDGGRLIELLHYEWCEKETAKEKAIGPWNRNKTSNEIKSDPDTPGFVVIREIGNPDTSEGKNVVRTYRRLKNASLPLIPRPDLQGVREQLLAEFPHAQQVIDTMLSDLAMRTEVYLRPTIFIGSPGTGKTRFAQQFLSALNVPNETFSCGGVSDGAIAGTPRRWATGEPSLPINLVRRFNCASPGIIMDEVEKTGASRNNGNLVDALLGMLEPQSARSWHDPYLEADVDISQVIWLATVNSLDTLSAPFRDRCRIITFPEPGQEHLPRIGNALLVQAYEELGMDKRWALPLTGKELDILGSYWKGGSVRHLRRLIDAVVATREKMTNQH